MVGYRIDFVRHGLTKANLEGKYIGTTDESLCKEGVEELYKKVSLNEYYSPQRVYVSPLKRCIETANILYPECDIIEIDELREMDFGDFENKKAVDIMETDEYKQFIKGGLDNPPPNGESIRDVVERCVAAVEKIVADMMSSGYTECAVVTHGGIIMNILSCFGVPKYNASDLACDFGEGFEVMLTAAMWQRSTAFEIMGRFPFIYDDDEPEEE